MKRILFFLIVAISIFSQESILKTEETDYLVVEDNQIEKNQEDILSEIITNENFSNEIISFLLEKGVDINTIDFSGNTAFMYSIKYHKLDIAKLLIANGADTSLINKSGQDALMLLIEEKQDSLAKEIIEKGIDVTRRDSEGNNYLHYAVKANNKELAKILCGLGVNPLLKNSERDSPRDLTDGNKDFLNILINSNFTQEELLFHALETNNEELILNTISKVSNLNFFNEDGYSPILLAAQNGNLNIIKEFVKKGADINQVLGRNYTTPLIKAIKFGNDESAIYLVENGAKIDIKDGEGKDALDYAIEENNNELIKYLLVKSNRLNYADTFGKSVLMKAIETDNIELVEYLLAKDLNTNLKDSKGYSALTYAVENNNYTIFQMLLNEGADINVLDKKGNNLLFHSLRSDFSKITDILVEKLPLKHKNLDGYNNFYYALDKRNLDVALILAKEGIEIQIPESDNYYMIRDIIEENKLELFKFLVKNGFNCENFNKNSEGNLLKMAINFDSFDIFKYLLTLNIPSHKNEKIQVECLLDSLEEGGYEYFNYLINNGSLTSSQLVMIFKENIEYIITNSSSKAVEIIEIFIKKGAKLDKKSLYYAVDSGNIEVAEYLIKKGIPLTYQDEYGNNLLCTALMDSNLYMADILIKNGLSVNSKSVVNLMLNDDRGFQYNHLDILDYLIKNGLKLTKEIEKKYAYLLFFIYGNNPEKFQYYYDLIRLNEYIQPDDDYIEYLLENNYIDAIKFIYNHKEEFQKEYTLFRFENIEFLIENNEIEMLKFFLGNDEFYMKELHNFDDNTLMFDVLVKINSIEMIDYFKSINANFKYIDKEKNESLLHKAVMENNLFLVKYCIDNNFDIEMTNNNGYSPLDLANIYISLEIFKTLYEKNPKIDMQKIIYDAIYSGNIKIIEYLISKGIVLKDYDFNNELLLNAIKGGNFDMIQFLIKNDYKTSGKKISEICIDDIKVKELLETVKPFY